jgi:minor extracellular serine protease Vpr
MRKFVGALGAAVFAATMISHAQSPQAVPVSDNESSGLWFVELSSPPTSDGGTVAALDRDEADFHSAASGAGVRYTEKRHYRSLWNGMTVNASGRDVSKLRSLPGVKSVFPVTKVYLSQIETQPGNSPELVTALHMTGADVAQDELGLTGRHVKVAVIDTGIDYDHPDLGGCFGPGCRVAKGYDLVGDAFNEDESSPLFDPVPHPDALPDDCNGHGTHVSGIVGANGGVKGVAPGVTFYAYRVFGCEGPTSSDIMLEAMERALDDGADVVNMSIGSAFQWPQYPTAQAANRLVRRGVVVVASAGNEGANGLYASSAPGIGKDVIGVASFDNIGVVLNAFSISPDNKKIGYNPAAGAPTVPVTGTFPMARTGTPASAADGCTAAAAGSLTGQIALIRRGTCSFYQKAMNAQLAGAAGVVLYNNVAGFISPTVAGTPAITIPVVAVTAANGVLINDRIAAGPVSLTWTNTTTSEPQLTGGLISSFSSYGLAADLSLKPDIGAPGGSIRSTLPLEQGGYGSLSGTSMASPHVAGAAALLLEARPRTRPDEVQERMQNTARPALWFGNPGLGFLDLVHRQGAGMLEIDDAILADAVVSPSSLALGEIESGFTVKRLEITAAQDRRDRSHRRHGGDDRHDDPPVTYTLTHVPALATGANTFVPGFFASFATVEFSAPTVTVGGRGDCASLFVKITPPAVPAARLFGGYIVLTPDDGGIVLRVPYAGYNGDYQLIQAVVPTVNGFPWLAKLVGTSLFNQPTGASFTLQGDDVPFILLHLDHQVRTLKMEVIDVSNGRSFNFADDEDYVGRNSGPTSFFAFTWDGTTTKRAGGRAKTVPNGTYRIELTTLKALGNPSNPAHTEHWTSPNITIARPATP